MYSLFQWALYPVVFLCTMFFSAFQVKGEGEKQLSVPLVFRGNVGQWEKNILFKGSSSSSNIFFTKKGMMLMHTRKIKTIQSGKEES